MKVTKARLEELIQAEQKLNALESGGVRDWDNYDDALKEYHASIKFEEKKEDLIYEIMDALGENSYELDRGGGITFNDDAPKLCLNILNKYKISFSNLTLQDPCPQHNSIIMRITESEIQLAINSIEFYLENLTEENLTEENHLMTDWYEHFLSRLKDYRDENLTK